MQTSQFKQFIHHKHFFCSFILVLLLIVCGFTVSSAKNGGTLRNYKHGDTLPSFKLPRLNATNSESINPGNGKPGIIMFFSIRPDFRKKRSLALLRSIADLSLKYKNRINITAVYSDKKEANIISAFIKSSAINITVLSDSKKKVYNKYGVFMMPLIVLTDSKGKLHEVIPYTFNIREIVAGNIKMLLGDWNSEQLVESLKPKQKFIKSDKEKEYIRRINYGKIMLSKRMYPQAIREFSNATKLMPKSIGAHLELGFAFISAKKFSEAEGSFSDALKINPDSDDAISGLGLSYYGQGQTDKALAKLESAFIAIKPRLEVIIALADIYEQKGDNNKANRLNKLAVDRLMTLYEQRWQ